MLRRDAIAFRRVVGPISSSAVLIEQDEMLTGWAKTRCKKTCITKGGFGKTAFTICASVSTVALISVNRDVRPSSLFGGVESGSGIVRHLIKLVVTGFTSDLNRLTTACLQQVSHSLPRL